MYVTSSLYKLEIVIIYYNGLFMLKIKLKPHVNYVKQKRGIDHSYIIILIIIVIQY